VRAGKVKSDDTARRSRLFGEAIYVLAGQALAAIGAIVGIRMLTSTVEPEIYGQIIIWSTAVTIFQQCVFGPLAVACQRFFSASLEIGQSRQYLRSIYSSIRWILGGGLVITLCCGLAAIAAGHPTLGIIALLAVTTAMTNGVGQIFDSIQNAARNRRLVAAHQGVTPWIRNCLAVGVITLVAPGAIGGLGGYALAGLLMCGSQWYFFRQRANELKRGNAEMVTGPPQPPVAWVPKMLHYSWPIGCWGLFTWLLTASDRWALGWHCSSADVGRYAVLYQLGFYPVVLLADAAQQLLAPIFFRIAGGGQSAVKRLAIYHMQFKVLALIIPFALLMPFLSWLGSEWIVRAMSADQYHEAAWLLPIATLAAVFHSVSQISTLSLISEEQTRRLLPIKLGTSLVAMAMFWFGAQRWGIAGATAGLAAAHLFGLTWTLAAVALRFLSTRRQLSPLQQSASFQLSSSLPA
jgi:O-antigen/teichoic acid export membrane protein